MTCQGADLLRAAGELWRSSLYSVEADSSARRAEHGLGHGALGESVLRLAFCSYGLSRKGKRNRYPRRQSPPRKREGNAGGTSCLERTRFRRMGRNGANVCKSVHGMRFRLRGAFFRVWSLKQRAGSQKLTHRQVALVDNLSLINVCTWIFILVFFSS